MCCWLSRSALGLGDARFLEYKTKSIFVGFDSPPVIILQQKSGRGGTDPPVVILIYNTIQ